MATCVRFLWSLTGARTMLHVIGPVSLAWQSSVQLSVGRLPCGATSGDLKRYNREACGARLTGGSVFWRRRSWLGSPLSNSVLVGCLVGSVAACATPCFCVGKGTGLVCASAAGWIFSFPACTLKVPSDSASSYAEVRDVSGPWEAAGSFLPHDGLQLPTMPTRSTLPSQTGPAYSPGFGVLDEDASPAVQEQEGEDAPPAVPEGAPPASTSVAPCDGGLVPPRNRTPWRRTVGSPLLTSSSTSTPRSGSALWLSTSDARGRSPQQRPLHASVCSATIPPFPLGDSGVHVRDDDHDGRTGHVFDAVLPIPVVRRDMEARPLWSTSSPVVATPSAVVCRDMEARPQWSTSSPVVATPSSDLPVVCRDMEARPQWSTSSPVAATPSFGFDPPVSRQLATTMPVQNTFVHFSPHDHPVFPRCASCPAMMSATTPGACSAPSMDLLPVAHADDVPLGACDGDVVLCGDTIRPFQATTMLPNTPVPGAADADAVNHLLAPPSDAGSTYTQSADGTPAGPSKRTLRRRRKRTAAARTNLPAHDWSNALTMVRDCMSSSSVSLSWDNVTELLRLSDFASTDAGLETLPLDSRDLVTAFLASARGITHHPSEPGFVTFLAC